MFPFGRRIQAHERRLPVGSGVVEGLFDGPRVSNIMGQGDEKWGLLQAGAQANRGTKWGHTLPGCLCSHHCYACATQRACSSGGTSEAHLQLPLTRCDRGSQGLGGARQVLLLLQSLLCSSSYSGVIEAWHTGEKLTHGTECLRFWLWYIIKSIRITASREEPFLGASVRATLPRDTCDQWSCLRMTVVAVNKPLHYFASSRCISMINKDNSVQTPRWRKERSPGTKAGTLHCSDCCSTALSSLCCIIQAGWVIGIKAWPLMWSQGQRGALKHKHSSKCRFNFLINLVVEMPNMRAAAQGRAQPAVVFYCPPVVKS